MAKKPKLKCCPVKLVAPDLKSISPLNRQFEPTPAQPISRRKQMAGTLK